MAPKCPECGAILIISGVSPYGGWDRNCSQCSYSTGCFGAMINGQRDGESAQLRQVSAAEQQLLKYVERISVLCARDRMTPDEMVACLFDELAMRDLAVDIHLAADIAGIVPHNARARFVEHVRTILQPGFHRPPFAYGGGRLATEDELRVDADEQTARVRGWAAKFRLVLGADSDEPQEGQN